MNIEVLLKEYANKTDTYLKEYYDDAKNDLIFEAEKYSLLSGGKRIRAFLVFEFCKAFGKSENEAAPFACAVEMIHAYSLIHDDLPCMDDDDFRRGKLSNHKVFGEAMAVLAGDALLTKAFEIAASNKYVPPHVAVEAVKLLAEAAGDNGMVGGQALDITAERCKIKNIDMLKNIHRLKTGAMIAVSAQLGCLAAGIDKNSDAFHNAEKYAENIGIAFQIIDDILDVVGDSSVLGKNVGSDKDNDKLTYMSFYDVKTAKVLAEKLTNEAVALMSEYAGCENLVGLAEYLLNRNH